MKEKLEDSASRTLSLISHKMRTPLSIINGYCDAINMNKEKEKFSPFTEKAFDEICKQGGKMATLVEKLLKFTKMENIVPTEMEKTEVNLKKIILKAAQAAVLVEDNQDSVTTKNDIVAKGPTKIEIMAPEDLVIDAEEKLLSNAIQELLENAIKFNNRMDKVIKIYCYKHSNYISISVKDSGSGIRPGEINKIFERFYQIDDFFTGQIDGWGLGLPYVKNVMDLHGGSISVVSDYGLGSVFSLNIPL
ncbi:signal transduction histidine kinase [Elusimicrobium posterum]|uniref:sensor histidine kinase n=1 Tax=Elusimicrobium posterum TaxID=3116653 RepID=UPI003C73CF5A